MVLKQIIQRCTQDIGISFFSILRSKAFEEVLQGVVLHQEERCWPDRNGQEELL